MAQTSVSIRSGLFVENAQEISSEFFGGNMLFDRDRVGKDGTFDEKAAALSLGLLRYPGGNVSEIFFDITNPENTIEEKGHSGSLMPLSEFLAYANDIGVAATFVAPTVPFMNGLATGDMTVAEVRSEMRAFLTDLKAGVYGDASAIKHMEIGNEYYGYDKRFDWNALEQYTEIAPIWAKEIREVFGNSLNISVQGGKTRGENDHLIETFQNKGGLVDSVIFHSYPWDLGQVYGRDIWKMKLANAWEDAGISENVFLSEWGISNQRFTTYGSEIGADQIEDGLARAIAMVEMAALQIKSGVDFSAVWPVQQNTRADLAGDEGQTVENAAHFLSEDSLTVAGEAFRMMAEVLPGMQMLDLGGAIDLDSKSEKDRFTPELLVRGFEDDKKIVIFASAWSLDDDLGEATLNLKLGSNFISYDLSTLTVAGANYTEVNADPVTYESVGLAPSEELTIRFSREYGLTRIVLHKDATVAPAANLREELASRLEGDQSSNLLRGDAAADDLWGRGGDDVLFGGGSDDQLKGGAGADWLHGGAGVDSLFGGTGADSLAGAGADDRLLGQRGPDSLHGGGGSDTLAGGGQDDALVGGRGADLLRGGGGGDEMVGGPGADRLFGNDGDDLLSGRSGADHLVGGYGDDTLIGGHGNDVIELGPGEDVASGGHGADLFIVRLASKNSTISDFDSGADLIAIYQADEFSELTLQSDGLDAIISVGDLTIAFEGVSLDQLDATDFVF